MQTAQEMAPVRPVPPFDTERFEALVVAAAAGEATAGQLRVLEQQQDRWRASLVRLLGDTEDQIDELKECRRVERDQVIADFEAERDRLAAALDVVSGVELPGQATATDAPQVLEAAGEVRLHASWFAGKVVLWAAGPSTPPASLDELERRLQRVGAPSDGWSEHPAVALPAGMKAPAKAIGLMDALGWLVAVGAGQISDDEIGSSVRWLGRLAVWALSLVASGSMVPTLRARRRNRNRKNAEEGMGDYHVRWMPAGVDQARLEALAAAMPGPVGALDRSDAKALTQSILAAGVDAVATDAAGRLELPAPPPSPRTTTEVAEAFLTRLDGSQLRAPTRAGSELAKRLERWARPVLQPSDVRLVVQLEPPDSGGAWFLSVLGPDPDGTLVSVEVALVDSRSKRQVSEELARLERLLPVLGRPGGLRRGEVYLSADEAWELMTTTGPALVSAGFDVRVPALSRRRPSPTLRLDAVAADPSVVGANQLADVRWSAVFDDVELTAEEINALAAQARPLVRSRGRWVELDRADLVEAAAALAERASTTRLTGAEVLRHAIGLEGAPLGGGISVVGSGWAADLLAQASAAPTSPVLEPEGFRGTLRHYQGEALAWLGFLDAVELGGILALDMGLGKTPTVLAHVARTATERAAAVDDSGSATEGVTLVIAPPAVVGNWAAEASRFTPGLNVVVHHGASRATARELAAEVAGADLVITTYGTAVRDIDALAEYQWGRIVLDEAQAIKNPTSETAQQLRRLSARRRLALTGTPIENGLGDLWALLDFTNPGLMGPRATFVNQLSGESRSARDGGEKALRAMNGILVFRRTKTEPSVAVELPERIDQLDHCTMTPEQIGLYQAVLDRLVADGPTDDDGEPRQGQILAAITALKQICNHPAAYQDDGRPLDGRSGKLSRLEEIVDAVFAAEEKVLVFTHFAEWGKRLAAHLTERTGRPVDCYHGGLARGARDRMVADFQASDGPGALVLSLKAGGTGLNLTAASHVVLYDRWWNPAVEDQARDRVWRIGQTRTVVSHRLVCPGTVDERVEEVVAGKRHVADLVLPKSSSLADLDSDQLRVALGLRPEEVLTETTADSGDEEVAA